MQAINAASHHQCMIHDKLSMANNVITSTLLKVKDESHMMNGHASIEQEKQGKRFIIYSFVTTINVSIWGLLIKRVIESGGISLKHGNFIYDKRHICRQSYSLI